MNKKIKSYALRYAFIVFAFGGFMIAITDMAIDIFIPIQWKWVIWLFNALFLTYIGFEIGNFVRYTLSTAYRDPLTGLYNRGYFYYKLNDELNKLNKRKEPLSLVIIDIDDFKAVNDTYGHIAGDGLLVELSKLLVKNIRENDKTMRWGGDEFVIVMPNTTSEGAYVLLERIRTIAERKIYNFCGPFTISVGIASVERPTSLEQFVELADNALYEAKKQKNIVVIA